MVAEQRETVQRIDADTMDIATNVSGAQRELLKYYASISSNRWLMLKIFGVLIVFVSRKMIFSSPFIDSAPSVPNLYPRIRLIVHSTLAAVDIYGTTTRTLTRMSCLSINHNNRYIPLRCNMFIQPTGIALTPVPNGVTFLECFFGCF
jgi:hypothetical protein